MKNSRLLDVLTTLSRKEVSAFSQFIASPYFNQREDLRLFWQYLSLQFFQLNIVPEKQAIFQKIYPENNYDAQQIRLLMSLLLKQIERFFACQALLQDAAEMKILQARAYRKRGLVKQFRYIQRDLDRLQNKKPFRDAAYLELQYQIQFEQYQFTSSQKRIDAQNLQEVSDSLDLAFIALKLRNTCLAISHQTVYNVQYEVGLLEDMLSYVREKMLLNVPAIGLYYHCYYALIQPAEERHFMAFKKMIMAYGHQFPAEEIRDLYLLAINYCIKRLNEGHQAFAWEGLELYKEGLQHKVLITNGLISRFSYRNIVAMGLIAEDFTWVASFISDYRSYLPKAHRESMFSFNMARLKYRRKNYTAALQLLQKSEYKDLLLNLAAKTIQLKIYYELEEFDLLHAHLKAMEQFIRRKKVIGYHRTNYLNLIRFVEKLLKLNPFDKEARGQLHSEIEASEVLTEKGWLVEKCKIINRKM